MPWTQAIFYRDERGIEPVAAFTESLSPRQAAKLDGFIGEHLNGRLATAPPPRFPLSSQVEGELRELRVRFANASSSRWAGRTLRAEMNLLADLPR